MIPDEQVARIRHLFHAEHWKIGTIAAELLLHPDTVRRALETSRFRSQPRLRAQLTDPYLDFLRQTLQQYPRLRATRLIQMIVPRGFTGSVTQLRRVVADLRPPPGSFSASARFPRRTGAGRLGLLWRSQDRPRPQRRTLKTQSPSARHSTMRLTRIGSLLSVRSSPPWPTLLESWTSTFG